MSVSIVPPRKEDSRYRYLVIDEDGNAHRGWLTYEIFPERKALRSIILLKRGTDFVSEKQRGEYNLLATTLNAQKGARFGVTKGVVNELIAGTLELPNTRVVVHKLGLVPAFVLPAVHEIAHEDQKIKVQVGLYPDSPSQPPKDTCAPRFVSSKLEFTRTLSVGLGTQFRRYLEDVAECFHDIEHHLSLQQVFERAREAEATLSQSIKGKLSVLMPSIDILRQYRRGRGSNILSLTKTQIFDSKTDTIFTASFARYYALYFLNALYRHIGVSSREQEYLDRFNSLEREFDARVELHFYKRATRDRLANLRALLLALKAYNSGSREDLEKVSAPTKWAQGFVEFAQFIAGLDDLASEFGIEPHTGRIFLSHHHEVDVPETLRKQLRGWLEEKFGDRTKLLFFRSKEAGPRIRPSIKRLIWMADSVEAVVPKKAEPIGKDVEKSYLWIGLEAEHGLLLDKRLMFLVEDGTDLAKVETEFQAIADRLLSPTASIPVAERVERLVQEFTDSVHQNFQITTLDSAPNNLSNELREFFDREAEAAVQSRALELLKGFLRQFPMRSREVFARIHTLVPAPEKKNKKWLARELAGRWPSMFKNVASGERAITAAWRLAKERTLNVGGEEHSLLSLHSRRYYSGEVLRIFRSILPTANEEDLLRLEIRLWGAYLDEDF